MIFQCQRRLQVTGSQVGSLPDRELAGSDIIDSKACKNMKARLRISILPSISVESSLNGAELQDRAIGTCSLAAYKLQISIVYLMLITITNSPWREKPIASWKARRNAE
jgi:hypothetical protein